MLTAHARTLFRQHATELQQCRIEVQGHHVLFGVRCQIPELSRDHVPVFVERLVQRSENRLLDALILDARRMGLLEEVVSGRFGFGRQRLATVQSYGA